MKKIITNKIQCKHCKDIIESKTVHQYVVCSCGKVAVDGGKNYLRRTGTKDDYIEMSIVEEQ